MSRRDEPLLRECEDVPEALRSALRIAVNDELPSAARLKRIEGHLVADVIASSARSASDSDVERWRKLAVARQHERTGETTSGFRVVAGKASRFTAAQIGVASLAALAVAWACVVGYRARRDTAPTTALPSVTQLPRPSLEPEPATAEPQRVAPGPSRPIASQSAPDPAPTALEAEAPRTAPSASSLRKAPLLSRSDPWGIASATKSTVPPPNTDAAAPSTAGEEDLLERATRLLATDPQKALSLMEQHRAAFTEGKLAQERDVVIIQALAKLGRLDAAQAVAKHFLAEHPDSPYAKDVLTLAGAPRR